MPLRNEIAVDVGSRRLRALLAGVDRGRVVVRRVLIEPLPDGIDRDDPGAVGDWVGRKLAEARFPKVRATVAISRERVVLKRLTLPTTDERELPEMARLAMQRELPFEPADAVIDFVVLGRSTASTTVLAVAAPRDVLAAVRDSARRAGLDVGRMSLRSMGSAGLFSAMPGDEGGAPAGPVLVVDIAGERVDFSVVVDGVIRFSRAGDLPEVDDPAEVTEAVVTEARRTWMSYRIVEESEDVRRAVVVGQRAVAERVAGQLGGILRIPTRAFDGHPLIDTARTGTELGEVWPLAGLLLAGGLDVESIDFANPRKAPDLASRRRQIGLAGAGALVVAALAGATWLNFELDALRDRAASLRAQWDKRRPEYYRYGRDVYKLAHLQQWESAAPDWLEHLRAIASMAPGTDQLVFSDFSADLAFSGVQFDRETGRFSAPAAIRIVLEGEAADRATADEYRGRLVDAESYDMSTAGPDAQAGRRLAFAFRYNLRSAQVAPEPGPAAQRTAGLGEAP